MLYEIFWVQLAPSWTAAMKNIWDFKQFVDRITAFI